MLKGQISALQDTMLAQSVPYWRLDGWNRRFNQTGPPVLQVHWLRDGERLAGRPWKPSAVAYSPPREGRDNMPFRHHAQAVRLGVLGL